MLLAIDTSGKMGGVALARYDSEYSVVLAEQEIAGGSYSAELVPTIQRILAEQEAQLADLTAIGVVVGPGSFTGLRVGLSAVKGLCESRNLPVVPVTMLELVAAISNAPHVTVLMDAARREVFCGEFDHKHGIPNVVSEQLLSLETVRVEGLALTPDANISATLSAVQVPWPRPSDLAIYAVKKLAKGAVIPAVALDAHYIRRSDAEIFSK